MGKKKPMWILFAIMVISILGILSYSGLSISADKVPTKIVVRAVSHDAKVIGSGVGGAYIRIVNLETGETLAEGKQEGGTGNTDRIMVQPHRRGEPVYDTPDTASFHAEIPLAGPIRVEIQAEAPLAYPQALQRGSKTLTLIPGNHILGEGVIIELNGLIVSLLSPLDSKILNPREEVEIKAEVKYL
jgi:hypothetical protein